MRISTPTRRLLALCTTLPLLAVLAACGGGAGSGSPGADGSSASQADRAVRAVAVGDVACKPGEEVTATTCQHAATAAVTADLDPELVIGLGDLQYENGSEENFERSWARTWGRFDDIIAPVPGNHEYDTPGAAGFTAYFGAEGASVREVGAWRLYLLDSNCEDGVDCEAQAAWVAEDLDRHRDVCTAVAMHHPRWSSGGPGPVGYLQPLWEVVVAGGADLSLAAHDHVYERFARIEETGRLSSEGEPGVRHFVVGTGGRSLYETREPREESRALRNDRFGVLALSLEPGGYRWRFVDTDGETLDEGADRCRST